MPLDGDKLFQGVGEAAGLLLERCQIRQDERRLLRLLVAPKVLGDALHRLQPPRVEAAQEVGGRRTVWNEIVLSPHRRGRQVAPGRVRELERDLAVEPGAAGVPAADPRDLGVRVCRRLQLAPEVEEASPEQIPVALSGVPIELEKRRHRLQGLADHRVVLLVPDLLVQECRQGRIEGRDLGHKVVERRRAQDRAGVARQTVQQQALLEPVVEDEVDRRPGFPGLIRRSHLRNRAQRRVDPVNEEPLFPGKGVGRPVAETHDAPPPLRVLHPVLAADDQGTEHIDPVVQVVVLRVDVDPDQVRILGRVGVG